MWRARFYWDGENGQMSSEDAKRLREADRVIALDFLIDVQRLAKDLYKEILENRP